MWSLRLEAVLERAAKDFSGSQRLTAGKTRRKWPGDCRRCKEAGGLAKSSEGVDSRWPTLHGEQAGLRLQEAGRFATEDATVGVRT